MSLIPVAGTKTTHQAKTVNSQLASAGKEKWCRKSKPRVVGEKGARWDVKHVLRRDWK